MPGALDLRMLGSVPGHVLSHVCGHVRSVCPLLGMPMFKHNDRDAVYSRGCPKYLGLALV